MLNASFRVKAQSDHDSTKYMNRKDSRHTVDEKGRIKRLMSTFGIPHDRNSCVDESTAAEVRVTQWLQDNESNFKKFDHMEEDLDLKFWKQKETLSPEF